MSHIGSSFSSSQLNCLIFQDKSLWHTPCYYKKQVISKEDAMSKFTDRFTAYFSAAAFAEAGEHETALQLAPASPTQLRKANPVFESLRKTFAAVAFAEEGLHAEAELMLAPATAPVRKSWSAEESFLDLVGLQNVRVRHMVLQV
jgi:hypothetical protein